MWEVSSASRMIPAMTSGINPRGGTAPAAVGAVDLTGRTALVTGGGSGIGRACAVALASAGARVHVVDLDADAAKAVADATGGHPHTVDVADAAALARLPKDVDVLVNNAGLQHVAPLTEFPRNGSN